MQMDTAGKKGRVSLSWWLYFLKGVLLIVLGIWMLRMPRESLNAIFLVIGLIITTGGVLEAVLALYYRKELKEWGWNFSAGILDILIGILLIANPDAILMLITLFISFWLVLRGILAVWEAFERRKGEQRSWKRVLLLGVFLLLLAIVLIWHPQVVGLTILFWIAISLISFGIFRIILAFRRLGHARSD